MPPLARVRKLRRSIRLLQLFSLLLMGVGAICLLPLPAMGSLLRFAGVGALASGGAGVVGLAFSWYRALVTFTAASWLAVLLGVIGFTQLCVTRPVQVSPFPWLLWSAMLLVALPASVLSSTLHILKVWRPQPMVSDTTAPLVTAAETGDLPPADAPPTEPDAVSRPVWPPPAPGGSGGGYYSSVSVAADTYVAADDMVDAPSSAPGPPTWPPRVD